MEPESNIFVNVDAFHKNKLHTSAHQPICMATGKTNATSPIMHQMFGDLSSSFQIPTPPIANGWTKSANVTPFPFMSAEVTTRQTSSIKACTPLVI